MIMMDTDGSKYTKTKINKIKQKRCLASLVDLIWGAKMLYAKSHPLLIYSTVFVLYVYADISVRSP